MPFRLTFALNPSRRKAARITLAFGGGAFFGDQEKALSRAYLDIMLRCLTELGVAYLRAHPETPRIRELAAQGLLVYREEPPGQEDWQDVPTSIHMGIFDCEDGACWLAAELIVRDGIQARAVWRESKVPDGDGGERVLFHIVVELPDGSTLDPSRYLGMG